MTYHPQCIRAGPPFTTRLRNSGGLVFPRVREWPNFICEVCTVRSVLDRELRGPQDWGLLCLERMRTLDMANALAGDTLKGYQGKLRILR